MSAIIGFLPPRSGEVRLFGGDYRKALARGISRRAWARAQGRGGSFANLTCGRTWPSRGRKRKAFAVPWTLERVMELFPR